MSKKKLQKNVQFTQVVGNTLWDQHAASLQNNCLIPLLPDLWQLMSKTLILLPNCLFEHEKRVFNIEESLFWLKC